MKLNTLISEIEHYRPDLTRRTIIHRINNERARLLKNRLNQDVRVNDSVQQTLLNVEMAVASDSGLDTFTSGGRVLKSRKALPALIARHNRHAFLRVRSPQVTSERFSVCPIEDISAVGHGRYNQRTVFVAWYDNHLYIPLLDSNPKLALISKLQVEALFEDPLAVMGFNDSTLTGRAYWQQDYPINAADWNYIKNLIISENGQNTQES